MRELVRFDPTAVPGKRLRCWYRVGLDLAEQVATNDCARSDVLDAVWVVADGDDSVARLRVGEVQDGSRLIPIGLEMARAQNANAERWIAESEDQLRSNRRSGRLRDGSANTGRVNLK